MIAAPANVFRNSLCGPSRMAPPLNRPRPVHVRARQETICNKSDRIGNHLETRLNDTDSSQIDSVCKR